MSVPARPVVTTPAIARVTPVLRRTDHPGGENLPAPEVHVTDAWRVACDGARGTAGATLGHPRVWLSIDAPVGWVDCGYCDARFVHRSALGRAPGTEGREAEAVAADGGHGH